MSSITDLGQAGQLASCLQLEFQTQTLVVPFSKMTVLPCSHQLLAIKVNLLLDIRLEHIFLDQVLPRAPDELLRIHCSGFQSSGILPCLATLLLPASHW